MTLRSVPFRLSLEVCSPIRLLQYAFNEGKAWPVLLSRKSIASNNPIHFFLCFRKDVGVEHHGQDKSQQNCFRLSRLAVISTRLVCMSSGSTVSDAAKRAIRFLCRVRDQRILTTVGQTRDTYDISLLFLEPSCLFRALDQRRRERRVCVPCSLFIQRQLI